MAPTTVPELPPVVSPAWVVGFLGHRRGLDEAALAPVVIAELNRLRAEVAVPGGTLHFYSSLADGADLLALDAADDLDLPLHVVLPLPEDDFFRSFQAPGSRERAERRLAAIRARPERHTWRMAPTSMQLPDAYFEADQCIIDASDVVLIVWDGKAEDGLGGTAQLVALARARNIPLVWIHRDTRAVIRERFDPAWPVRDRKLQLLEGRGVTRLACLGADTDTRGDTIRLKRNLSALADKDARWFRNAVALVSGVSGAAALCGAIIGQLHHDTPGQKIAVILLSLGEFLLLLWVLLFKVLDRRKQVRDEWIDARFGAELYRGLKSSQPLLDPLHHPVCVLRPEWRRFALTLGLRLHAEAASAFELLKFRADYKTQRIANQQEVFFGRHGRSALRWARAWNRIFYAGIAASALVVTFVCFNRLWEQPWVTGTWGLLLLGVLPVLCPLVAGLASSLTLLLDDDRRAARYPAIEQRLTALAAEADHQHTLGSLRQFVAATETMLLDELLEWYSVTSRADPG